MSAWRQLLLVALAQGLALLLTKLLTPLMPSLPEAQLIMQGSMAAMGGRLLRLPYWWVPINLLLPLAFGLITAAAPFAA